MVKFLASFAILMVMVGCSKPSEPAVAIAVNAKPVEDSCALKIPQQGRQRPEYEGVTGYITIPTSYFNDRAPHKTPWTVDALKEVGPSKWVPSGEKVAVKTSVTIVSAIVYHSGYGRYKGEAIVRTEDGSQKVINADFVVRTAWWKCSIAQATHYAPVIVQSVGTPQIVESNGDWGKLAVKELLFCKGGTFNGRSVDQGKASCMRLQGKKRDTHVLVKEADVSIVY